MLFKGRMFILLVSLLWAGPAFAADSYPLLRESRDKSLQSGLEEIVVKLDLSRAVSEKRLGLSLADISNLYQPRVAGINEDHMFYAASLPKIMILFGLFKKMEEGSLQWKRENLRLAVRMIRDSSNESANQLFYLVGAEYIASLAESPKYRLYEKDRGGGLWMGKEFGKRAAWKREPLGHFSHAASPLKVARFYYLLETNRLVSAPYAEKMKEVMSRTTRWHKFAKGLHDYCPEAKFFRKSGTWENFHADSALVEHQGRKYIAVALCDDPQGEQWIQRLVVEFDGLIRTSKPGL